MSSPLGIARRMFLASAAATLCDACGMGDHTFLSDVPAALKPYLTNGSNLHLTRAEVNRIGYASIAVRLGDGPQALLILGRFDGDELNWISAKREVVVTRRGRVVKTYGLPQDLTATNFLTPDPIGKPGRDFAPGAECLRTLDFESLHQDGILARSTFRKIGSARIEILGERLETELWEERGSADLLGWDFVNRYWIAADSGYVWKSLQATAPTLPVLEIIVYRRAADTTTNAAPKKRAALVRGA